MKKIILLACLAAASLTACKRNDDAAPAEDFATTQQTALNDFVDIVAIPIYADLATRSHELNTAITALNANATSQNLETAKTAWLNMRTVWEQSEGFLFGPVEDDFYDPYMDTWPTDFAQMDSLMNTSFQFNQTNLETVTLSLRGFHPIEYILFGDHGNRTATAITSRQKEYMVGLSADLVKNCDALSASWAVNGGNYGQLVKTAGNGSNKYASRHEIFKAMADGLATICEEVGTGKMEEPFAAQDPKTVESPYSGNSVTDFKNNIIGLENVYLGRYGNKSGKSLSSVVAANNQALDNKIRTQITAAINSFDKITVPFETAITTQRTQIQNTQAALAALQATLEGDLNDYIVQYIKD